MEHTSGNLTFTPAVPKEFSNINIKGLHYRGAVLTVKLEGAGTGHKLFVDGASAAFLSFDLSGSLDILLSNIK